MAVSDSDAKSRAILEKQTKKGEEYMGFQEAQGQLMNIQAERQANLNQQRALGNMEMQNNQSIAQAAEILAASGGGAAGGMAMAAPQTGPNSTQGILNKFGIGKPGTKSSVTTQTSNSPQKIQITNNNTTTNNIQVSQPQIPMQAPVIPMRTPGGDNTDKFKVWVSNAFAKQNEAAAIRDKEYQKREWSLTRSANKMIRKMGELGKAFAEKMNPKNVSNMFGDQLKVVMFLMGFQFVVNNIEGILNFSKNISKTISDIKEWFTGKDGEVKSFGDFFVKLFGGKPGESGWTAFKELGKEIGSRIKDEFSALLESRGRAMKAVKFPDVNLKELDISGIVSTVGTYLGDLMTAMVSGSDGVKNGIMNGIKNTGRYGNLDEGRKGWGKYSNTDNGSKYANNSSMGDAVMYDSEYKKRFKMSKTDYNSSGNLSNNVGASMKQALRLANIASQQGSGVVNSDEFASGLDALKKSAQGRGGTLVGDEFFSSVGNALGIPTTMQQVKGTLEQRNVRYISVPKTEADWIAEGAGAIRGATKGVAENWINDTVGGGSLGGMLVSDVHSTAKGWGNLLDGNLGEGISDLTLGRLAGLTDATNVAYEAGKGWLKKVTGEDNKIIAVEAGDPRYPESKFPTLVDPHGNPMISTQYYLTPNAINKIEAAAQLSLGDKQFSFDFNERNFKLIDKLLVDYRNKLNKQSTEYRTAVATSGLSKYSEDFNKIDELVAQDNFDQSVIDAKYKYGRGETFVNNVSAGVSKAVDIVSSAVEPITSVFTGESETANYDFLKGNGAKVGGSNLTLSDFKTCADSLKVDLAIILALRELEVGDKTGFLPDGRPRILFEGHVFWKELKERGKNPADYYVGNEDILYPKWTKSHYLGGVKEYHRLEKAVKIDKDAALMSASWGMFQIMGFNYKNCDCSSIEEFVNKVSKSDKDQLDLFRNFIKNRKPLLDALKKLDFEKIALYYNGTGYKENNYDVRLKNAYYRIRKYLENINIQKYEDDNMYSDLDKDITSHEALYNIFNVSSLNNIDLSNLSYDRFKKYMSEDKFNKLVEKEDFSKIKTVNDLINSNFWKQGIINSDAFNKDLETTHKNLKAPEKDKLLTLEDVYKNHLSGEERGAIDYYSLFEDKSYNRELDNLQNIYGDDTRSILDRYKWEHIDIDRLKRQADWYKKRGDAREFGLRNKIRVLEELKKQSGDAKNGYIHFKSQSQFERFNSDVLGINNFGKGESAMFKFLYEESLKDSANRKLRILNNEITQKNDENYANWEEKHAMAKLIASITGESGLNSDGSFNWGSSISDAIEFGIQNPGGKISEVLSKYNINLENFKKNMFTGEIDPTIKSTIIEMFKNKLTDKDRFELLNAYQEDLSGMEMDVRNRNLHTLTRESYSNWVRKDKSLTEQKGTGSWLDLFKKNSNSINELRRKLNLDDSVNISPEEAAEMMEKGSASSLWKKYGKTIETSDGFKSMKTKVSNTLSTIEQIIQPNSEKYDIIKGDKKIVTLEKLNPNGEPNITLNQVAEKLKNGTWDIEGISKAEGELLAQQIDILNKTNNSIVDLGLILAGVYDNTYVNAAISVVKQNTSQPEQQQVDKETS